MADIVKVEHLTKIYKVPMKQHWLKALFVPKNKDLLAVNDISFTIKAGESVAFLGPNGAGKTTTLKMLTGLLHPENGWVSVLGHNPTQREYSFLKSIALVMGNKSGLAWDLSPRQNYELFQTMYDIPKEKITENIGQLVNLLSVAKNLDTPVRKLSLGQRMKFELIGAILHQPKIMFLDEPTIGLDVVAKRNIREFLRKINREQGTTIVLTSHDMADIEKVCERVIVINDGKIIFDDYLDHLNLRYRGKKYLTITFEKKVAPEELAKFGHVIDSKELSHTLEIDSASYTTVIAKISSEFPVDDIDIRSVPLDEIMEDMFRKQVEP